MYDIIRMTKPFTLHSDRVEAHVNIERIYSVVKVIKSSDLGHTEKEE